MDDEVGAQIERALQDRRAETVVDGDQDAARVRDRDQRRNVGNLGERVGRRFEEKKAGLGADRRVPGIDVSLIAIMDPPMIGIMEPV